MSYCPVLIINANIVVDIYFEKMEDIAESISLNIRDEYQSVSYYDFDIEGSNWLDIF